MEANSNEGPSLVPPGASCCLSVEVPASTLACGGSWGGGGGLSQREAYVTLLVFLTQHLVCGSKNTSVPVQDSAETEGAQRGCLEARRVPPTPWLSSSLSSLRLPTGMGV